jgi:cell division protein FtsI/penicillin-binding protein 2
MPPSRNANRANKSSVPSSRTHVLSRIRAVYTILIILCSIFIVRLFYLQIIKHDYYQQAANSDQLKQYEIPAQRGMIEANSGGQVVPIVLNEQLYTLFADPPLLTKVKTDAADIQKVIGGSSAAYEQDMATPDTEYVVLAKQLTLAQQSAILALKLPGIATQANNYRTYPNGSLASQLLGFVDQNGNGQYGIEQALNSTLSGTNGQVKAVTDAQGIPLVGDKSNILKNPVNGDNVVLTINIPIQQQLETILQAGLKKVNSNSGSVTILDPNNGNVVAMADYPTYDPTNYADVSSPAIYQNAAVDSPLEVGSIMKTLTVSAAMNTNSITGPSEVFNDPGSYTIDGSTITDIAQDSGVDKGPISVTSILVNSLNTGATWLLSQMGGGQINQKARDTWYDYMVNHYHLGSATGIQQGYEASGYIPNPDNGSALDLTYANTAFGQAMTATPLQMAAAVSAILNGGTYYQPNLVQSVTNPNTGVQTTNQPKIWKKNIVNGTTSSNLEQIMEAVVNDNYYFYQVAKPKAGYVEGGKTGTAQFTQPGGGYSATLFNGTFVGFIGTNSPQYVIMVEVNTPNIPENSIDTYAGAGAAAPIFGSVVNMLVNGGYVN